MVNALEGHVFKTLCNGVEVGKFSVLQSWECSTANLQIVKVILVLMPVQLVRWHFLRS